MDRRRFTMAFPGGAASQAAMNWNHRGVERGGISGSGQGSAPGPNRVPKRLTEWDRLNRKKQQEHEIKRSLFEPPDLFAIEVKELEDAADALDRAIARIPSSGEREVGDDSAEDGPKAGVIGPFIVGPDVAQYNADPGISITDLFDHSYSPPPPLPKPHRWLWIPKSRVLEAAVEGFPASAVEIRRLGGGARKIAPAHR